MKIAVLRYFSIGGSGLMFGWGRIRGPLGDVSTYARRVLLLLQAFRALISCLALFRQGRTSLPLSNYWSGRVHYKLPQARQGGLAPSNWWLKISLFPGGCRNGG